MAGAFASGFQMGGSIFNQAERNRLEQAAEERRATEFAQAQEDRTRLIGLREQEDALRNQLTRPNLENYALAPAGGMGGLSMRAPVSAPAQLPAGDTGLTMPQIVPSGVAGSAGEPTYRTTATMGLQAPEPSTRQPTFNAAPTGAAAEELLGRMALLKGDTAGYRASQDAAKGFRYADAYKNARQSWDAMSNDEREALISKASYDTNIPGFGTWVPGKGKTEGYMNYMAPGKDPVKLSASEAREIYALTQAMEIDPMKARTDLEKASDKVRSVLAQSFEAQTKGVTQNNLTMYHVADLAEKGRHNLAGEANQRAHIQALITRGQVPTMLVNDKNEPVPVVMSDLKRVGGVVQLPTGLRLPKDVQQATALEQRAFESLAKTDAWQRAERKGDMAEMNRLMVGRGLDPAKHGGAPPAADWQIATGNKASAPPQGLNTTPSVSMTPAVPTPPTERPKQNPGESLQSFRQRLVSWDENRMAYEDYQANLKVQEQMAKNAAGLRRPLVP